MARTKQRQKQKTRNKKPPNSMGWGNHKRTAKQVIAENGTCEETKKTNKQKSQY